MEIQLLRGADYPVSRWAGGSTAQIYLYPETGDYGRRDFLFRVSTALIQCQQSEFTLLPGVRRQIMMLEGTARLTYQGHGQEVLEPYQPASFDGGWHTSSQGAGVDFNLMLQGQAQGRLFPLRLEAGEKARLACPAGGFALAFLAQGQGLACQGLTLANKDCLLLRGEGQAWLENSTGAPLMLACAQVRLSGRPDGRGSF